MIFLLIGIVFVILKLTRKTAIKDWNWWSVITPFWAGGLVVIGGLHYRFAIDMPGQYFARSMVDLVGVTCLGFIFKGFKTESFYKMAWYWIAAPALIACLIMMSLLLLPKVQ